MDTYPHACLYSQACNFSTQWNIGKYMNIHTDELFEHHMSAYTNILICKHAVWGH